MKPKSNTALRGMQKQASEGGTCAKCGRKTDYLTVDHIVPLAIVLLLLPKEQTYDDEWNFWLLCRPCNKLKGCQLDFTDERTLPNLKRYIDKAEAFYWLSS